VPQTPLATVETLRGREMKIDNINQEMTLHLDEIRINTDNNFTLKSETDIVNKLFDKRKKK
jgi:hypothetical protein